MTLYVVIYVCTIGAPCNERTARAYQAFRAPPGIINCGVPALTQPIIFGSVGPDPSSEYLRVRCKLAP